jgi:hypothetical protein
MAAKRKVILVEVADSLDSFNESGPVLVDEFDTLKEAKARAKWWLTEEAMNRIERSERFGYAVVTVDGECRAEYVPVGEKHPLAVSRGKATKAEQHGRYLDCGPGAWDDRDNPDY